MLTDRQTDRRERERERHWHWDSAKKLLRACLSVWTPTSCWVGSHYITVEKKQPKGVITGRENQLCHLPAQKVEVARDPVRIPNSKQRQGRTFGAKQSLSLLGPCFNLFEMKRTWFVLVMNVTLVIFKTQVTEKAVFKKKKGGSFAGPERWLSCSESRFLLLRSRFSSKHPRWAADSYLQLQSLGMDLTSLVSQGTSTHRHIQSYIHIIYTYIQSYIHMIKSENKSKNDR